MGGFSSCLIELTSVKVTFWFSEFVVNINSEVKYVCSHFINITARVMSMPAMTS